MLARQLPECDGGLDGAHAGAEAVVPAPGLLREGVAPAQVRQHPRVTVDRRFFGVGHGVPVAKPTCGISCSLAVVNDFQL